MCMSDWSSDVCSSNLAPPMEELDRLFGGGLGFIAEGEEADQPLLWRCRGYPGDGESVALQFFGVSRERPPFDPFFLQEARASEDEPVILDFSGDASTGQSLHRSRLRQRDCLFRGEIGRAHVGT